MGEYVLPVQLADGTKYWLDAVDGTHWSRYMNHDAQSPNVYIGLDASISALKDIRVGEELCFDYGDAYWPKTVVDRVHGTANVCTRGAGGWVVTYPKSVPPLKQWWLPDRRVLKQKP